MLLVVLLLFLKSEIFILGLELLFTKVAFQFCSQEAQGITGNQKHATCFGQYIL